MDKNEITYRICPPKLNEKHKIKFLTIEEILCVGGLVMGFVVTKIKLLFFIAAAILVFQLKPTDDTGCLSQYCLKLIKYVFSSQVLETVDNKKGVTDE